MSILSKLTEIKGVEYQGEAPDLRELYRQNTNIAWPAAVEGALQSIISSIDTMMVGSLGYAAIAAVGLVGQPRMILLVLVQALCVGTTAVVARRKGADNQKGANDCLQLSMILVTLLGLVMAALGYIFAEPFISFAGANSDTLDMAVSYFRVICLGFPLNCWHLCICAAMRAIGQTRITMTTNVTANLVNLFFNYCLINGNLGFPKLGVTGAAIATVIGTCVATAMAFFVVLKKDGYLTLRYRAKGGFEPGTLKSLLTVGSSSIAESVFLRIGFFINTKLIANLGTGAMAVYQVVSQVSSLSFTLGDGVAAAGTSLVGQSLGAGRTDLAHAHIKISRRISVFVSIGLMILITVFHRGIASLFTSDADIVAGAAIGFIPVVVGMIPQNGRIVYSGCLRGAGDVKFVALCSLISVAVLRPIATYLLCYPLNGMLPALALAYTGPWIAFVIDSIVREVLMRYRIKGGKWMTIRL